MGIFTPTKPKITEREVRELGNELVNLYGLTDSQRQFVEGVLLRPHMEKSPYETAPSISKEEVDKLKEALSDKSSAVYRALKDKRITDVGIERILGELDSSLVKNR